MTTGGFGADGLGLSCHWASARRAGKNASTTMPANSHGLRILNIRFMFEFSPE
jgi:hypothetical protein